MQEKTTNTIGKYKKYGEPYSRRHLFQRGNIKDICNRTGFSYVAVTQQIRGDRKIHPLVKSAADVIADEMQQKIDSLK